MLENPVTDQTAIVVRSVNDGELTVLEQRQAKPRAFKQEPLTGRTMLV